jgi:hypothetical protein
MAKNRTIELTAVPGRRISVGLNYPWAWNKWGAFFGSGEKVPGDTPGYDVWLDNLDRNLGQIRDIVSVVRIFLFGNFANLGSTKPGQGPLIAQVVPSAGASLSYVPVQSYVLKQPWWNFVPPSKEEWEGPRPGGGRPYKNIYIDQLDRMFAIFNKHLIKVIPVLTDAVGFAQGPKPGTNEKWTQRAGWKTDIITDPTMRTWFLENVVDPFLEISVSGDNAKAIFAWEVANEPGQVTASIHMSVVPEPRTSYYIPRDQMNGFLSEVVSRIRAKGLKSTVGHHYEGDLSLLETGDFRQFHYYPHKKEYWGLGAILGVPYNLPEHKDTDAFIGEFQSAKDQGDQGGSIKWPEITENATAAKATDPQGGDGYSCISARLKWIENKGYGLAILWPDQPNNPDPDRTSPGVIDYEPATAAQEPLHYSQKVLDGIRSYVNS